MLTSERIRIPDIDWVKIPGGTFIYGDEKEGTGPTEMELSTFYMSRYLVTYVQFQCFADAPDYNDDRWWAGMPDKEPGRRIRELNERYFQFWNQPRQNVMWYQAVAFTRWLSDKLSAEITLPTEQQYERAARGTDGREYPWGDGYREGYANIDETRLDEGQYYLMWTSVVGIYLQGASPDSVLDLSGNLFTMCLNKENDTSDITVDTLAARRVLRGGSWISPSDLARAASRLFNSPSDSESINIGFVIVRADET